MKDHFAFHHSSTLASSNLLQIQNGYKAFGQQVLFDNVTFSINEDEHIGIIGPNGAGKTTLFKILNNEDELNSGQIIRSHSLRLGYLSQHDLWLPEETGNSYLERVCKIPVWEAKTLGRSLQIDDKIYAAQIRSLSGGYRMRIKLVGLLGSNPNLMLLDEPTNYLDLETTLILERFLQNYEGAFLLISHDREFLRRTTDHTLEVEAGEITKFNGHIDDYFEQKALLESQLAAQARNQSEKRKAILEFVERFGAKATKAKQAQSRLKMLDKMETIEIKAAPVKSKIQIAPPPHTGRTIIKVENADFGYSEKTILKNVNFEIKKGEHVAVVGLNGTGKSTLIKGLSGSLPPLKGNVSLGYQVQLSMFNQFVAESLDPNLTVLESLEEAAPKSTSFQEIRNMAGALLFGENGIQKKIQMLSGGEKSRVALGQVLLQNTPCLLLDEPTNHLDFHTVEALTQALEQYTGTILVVSHDRGFIRRIAKQIIEIRDGGASYYPGTYDDYVWHLQNSSTVNPVSQTTPVKTPSTVFQVERPQDKPKTDLRETSRRLRELERKKKKCEDEITRLEAENAALNKKIAETAKPDPKDITHFSQNSIHTEDLENQWLQYEAEIEKLKHENKA